MAGSRLRRLMQFVRSFAASDRDERHTDGYYLQCFAEHRDEEAFAVLVQRHGPMVLEVCRRMLNDQHLAEDAFQATFLVLAKKAGSIHHPSKLNNWLYGTAYRVASRERAKMKRQRDRENCLQDPSTVAARNDSPADCVRPVLDEELQRLPEKYRLPILCCCIDGKTRQETARLLGWSEGTVAGRLARARDLLRQRLARRGIEVTTTFLMLLLSKSEATAKVPPVLSSAAIHMAVCFATDKGLAGGTVPPATVSLANGVIKDMWLSNLKFTLAGCVLLGVLAWSFWAYGLSGPEANAAKAPPPDNANVVTLFVLSRYNGFGPSAAITPRTYYRFELKSDGSWEFKQTLKKGFAKSGKLSPKKLAAWKKTFQDAGLYTPVKKRPIRADDAATTTIIVFENDKSIRRNVDPAHPLAVQLENLVLAEVKPPAK